MKKFHLLILLITILILEAGAQNTKRIWSDGKLSWDDFVLKQSETEISGFKYMIEYHTEKQKSNDTTILRFETECYIHQPETWAAADSRNNQQLRYHQVIFDLAESYRRTLQNRLDHAASVQFSDYILQNVMNECRADIQQFKTDSKDGQNMKTIVLWEQIMTNRLAKQPENALPEFTVGNFGYGMHIGLGTAFYTGNTAKYFTPALFLNYGFYFSYKKSNLFLNAILGGNRVHNTITNIPGWNEGMRTGYALGDISYGYTITDNAKIRLVPFAGIGFTEQSASTNDTDANGLNLNSFTVLGGLTTYFKIRHRLNLLPDPLLGLREITETSIKARLFLAGANYGSSVKGASINLSVSISGMGKTLRLKE